MLKQSAAWSLLDQLASASGLFVFTMFVTKALEPAQFGAFSVFLAWVSLLGALLNAALIDSSTVLGSRREAGDQDWSEVAVHACLTLLFASLTACALVWAIAGPGMALTLVLLFASEAAVSGVALVRRSGYIKARVSWGTAVSLTSLVLTVLIVPVCVQRPQAQVQDAIWARLAINALVACIFGGGLLKGWADRSIADMLSRAKVLVHFSRTYMAGSFIFWLTNSLQLVLIGHALSLQDAAGFRAAQLLVLPAVQMQAAVYQVMLPRTVQRASQATFTMRGELRLLVMAFVAPVALYAAALAVLAPYMLEVVFGPSYRLYAAATAGLAVLAILESCKQVAVVLIYANDRKRLFMRYRLGSIVLLAVGIAPALWFGKLMAFVVMSGVVSALLLIYLAWQLCAEEKVAIA